MKESVKNLKEFLETSYIKNKSMGSPDMNSAARDLLTDLLHLGDEEGFYVLDRLESAQEVYEQELHNELSAKTGVVG